MLLCYNIVTPDPDTVLLVMVKGYWSGHGFKPQRYQAATVVPLSRFTITSPTNSNPNPTIRTVLRKNEMMLFDQPDAGI